MFPEFQLQLNDQSGQTLDPLARAGRTQYFYVSKHLVSPKVKNFLPNVLDVHRSQYVEMTHFEQ